MLQLDLVPQIATQRSNRQFQAAIFLHHKSDVESYALQSGTTFPRHQSQVYVLHSPPRGITSSSIVFQYFVASGILYEVSNIVVRRHMQTRVLSEMMY